MKADTKWVVKQLKMLPKIKTNKDFMDKLMKKIKRFTSS